MATPKKQAIENPERTHQHLCVCAIDLSGEKLTVVHKDETNPIPWTEIRVIQQIHGDDSIFDIRPIALAPRESPAREKERLILKYGREAVEAVYAGRSFNMEFFVPGWPIDPADAKPKEPDRPRPPRIQSPDDDGASSDLRV